MQLEAALQAIFTVTEAETSAEKFSFGKVAREASGGPSTPYDDYGVFTIGDSEVPSVVIEHRYPNEVEAMKPFVPEHYKETAAAGLNTLISSLLS